VLWIDSDIIRIPNNVLNLLVGSNKDIVTTVCAKRNSLNYDGNVWKGPRRKPTPEELEGIRRGEFWEPRSIKPETKALWQLIDPNHTEQEYVVPIDSVGGTILYVKADVHREGVAFATSYVIGAEWDMLEGWDGIETEGLCYMARPLGYSCWGMPNVYIEHTPY